MRFSNMGDYLVLVFSLFLFPLSTAFLLGMFWKRTTSSGAFYGMVVGVGGNIVHYALYHFGVLSYRTEMAANIYIIIVGWLLAFFVIVGLSLVTEPRPESELEGLVYSLARTLRGSSMPWYVDPKSWAVALLLMLTLLEVIFW
jgi:SSS family solute:Na+ symporter